MLGGGKELNWEDAFLGKGGLSHSTKEGKGG